MHCRRLGRDGKKNSEEGNDSLITGAGQHAAWDGSDSPMRVADEAVVPRRRAAEGRFHPVPVLLWSDY